MKSSSCEKQHINFEPQHLNASETERSRFQKQKPFNSVILRSGRVWIEMSASANIFVTCCIIVTLNYCQSNLCVPTSSLLYCAFKHSHVVPSQTTGHDWLRPLSSAVFTTVVFKYGSQSTESESTEHLNISWEANISQHSYMSDTLRWAVL